jgi:RNA polymerase sigma-70 factor (ECF subfamily)
VADAAGDERAAIARLRRGDVGGLEALVRAHQVRAVRAAYLVTRDRGLAEEVVQEAFLRAYDRIDQFDPARPFGPWFLRSVVNAAVRAATRASRLVPIGEVVDGGRPVDPLVDAVPGPDAVVLRAETREAVWEALGELSAGQRAAVVLRYFLGLDVAESADRLGVPAGTVKRRLHDARRRLRALLSPTLAEEPK